MNDIKLKDLESSELSKQIASASYPIHALLSVWKNKEN